MKLKLFTALFFSAVAIVNAQNACPWAKKAGGTQEDFGSAIATDASGNVYSVGNFFSQSITIGSTTLQNQPYIAFNYGSEVFLAKYDACGNVAWAKRAGGNSDTYATGIAADSVGNTFITGFFNADTATFGSLKLINTSGYDAFLVKYDANGNALWAKQGTGNYSDRPFEITLDKNGNIYLAGSFSSDVLTFGSVTLSNGFTGNDEDVFVGKFDNNGNAVWLTKGSGDYNEEARGLGVDGAGNVYVSGYSASSGISFGSYSGSVDYYDIFVAKLNSSGVPQWLKVVGGSGAEQSLNLATDASGNSYVSGFYNSSSVAFGTYSVTGNSSSFSSFLAKYDANGNALWANGCTQDYYTESYMRRVKLDAQGNPYVFGYYDTDSLDLGAITLYNNSLQGGGGDSLFDVFVAKYKSNGVLAWAHSAGGAKSDYGFGMALDKNSNLYVSGEYQSPSITFGNTTLSSTNQNGDMFITNTMATSALTPDICMVTTDSLSINNIVYWDKTNYPSVDSFIVYREVSSGTYKRIGAVSHTAIDQFIDNNRNVGPANGDPNIGTYRYKLQTRDTSGAYGVMSPYHNSVYFVNNNNGTFTWNLYSVENASITPVSSFSLQRDDNNTGAWHTIGTVAGTQTTLNDPNYNAYQSTGNWRVEADGFNCSVTARYTSVNGSQSIIRQKSHSNSSRMAGNGIKIIAYNNALEIYPNPSADGRFHLSNIDMQAGVSVTDLLGNLVFEGKGNFIDLSGLGNGTYILQSVVKGQNAFTKIVVSK